MPTRLFKSPRRAGLFSSFFYLMKWKENGFVSWEPPSWSSSSFVHQLSWTFLYLGFGFLIYKMVRCGTPTTRSLWELNKPMDVKALFQLWSTLQMLQYQPLLPLLLLLLSDTTQFSCKVKLNSCRPESVFQKLGSVLQMAGIGRVGREVAEYRFTSWLPEILFIGLWGGTVFPLNLK